MLGRITFILIKLKLLQPNKKILNGWTRKFDAKKLRYVLINGNYKIRPLAAQALADINDTTAIPLLLNSINDNIYNVSISALSALDDLDTNLETDRLINRKRFYWTNILNRKANKPKKKYGKANIYRWERKTKKNFEMVKERLKRPIS